MPRLKDWTKRPIKPAKEIKPAAPPPQPFGSGPFRDRIRLALADALILAAATPSSGEALGLPVKALVEMIAQYATIHVITVFTVLNCTTQSFAVWNQPPAPVPAAAATGESLAPAPVVEWLAHSSYDPPSFGAYVFHSGSAAIKLDRVALRPTVWNGVPTATVAAPELVHVTPERGSRHPHALLISTGGPTSVCRLERIRAHATADEFRLTTLAGATDPGEVMALPEATAREAASDGLNVRFGSIFYLTCSPSGEFMFALDHRDTTTSRAQLLRRIDLSGRHAVSVVHRSGVRCAFDERDHDIVYFACASAVDRLNLKTGESTPVKLTLPLVGTCDIQFVPPHHLIIARIYRILIHNLATNNTQILAGGTVPGLTDGDATKQALFQQPTAVQFIRGVGAEPDRLYVSEWKSIRIVTGSIVGCV